MIATVIVLATISAVLLVLFRGIDDDNWIMPDGVVLLAAIGRLISTILAVIALILVWL